MRATLSRRDQLFNDDWVGLSLDAVGNRPAVLRPLREPPRRAGRHPQHRHRGGEPLPGLGVGQRRPGDARGLRRRDPRALEEHPLRERPGREDGDPLLAPRQPTGHVGVVAHPAARQALLPEPRPPRAPRPAAAALARGRPERDLHAQRGARVSLRLRGPRERPRDRGEREVRGHLDGDGRGHRQPRLQPGRVGRLPGRSEPALPGLLLREAALLHGGHGHLRARGGGRRRRDAHRRPHPEDRGPRVGRQGGGQRGPSRLRDARRVRHRPGSRPGGGSPPRGPRPALPRRPGHLEPRQRQLRRGDRDRHRARRRATTAWPGPTSP